VTTNQQTQRIEGPSYSILAILFCTMIAGSAAALVAAGQGVTWATGALAGWLGAGVMGLCGFWTMRRALRGGQKAFLKYLLGGMLARLAMCGVYAGLAMGLDWFDRNGFVLGLLLGIAVFMCIEIIGLERAARKISSAEDGQAGSAQGAISRG